MTDAVIVTQTESVTVTEIPHETVSVSDVEVIKPQFNDVLIINQGELAPHYVHTQLSPATAWIINHNLNRYPSIELLTVGLVKFEADIAHVSLNQSIVTIATAMAGLAQCN